MTETAGAVAVASAPPPRTRAEARQRRETAGVLGAGFRPDIQGLRALAVLLVLVYHLWPETLTGGYIGVDVFFVISGYLISQHLFREVERTGTVKLSAFWARRIRRLLPASLLVLVATFVATMLWMPANERIRSFTEIAASGLYVVNWLFARDSVDYLARDNSPSIVQHYWTLSVEEQFYVLWPILLVVVLFVVAGAFKRRGSDAVRRVTRRVFAVVLIAIFVSSLVLSIGMTGSSPGEAYFNTFVRVWEFAAGGLLALATIALPAWFRSSTGAVAVAGVLAAWFGVALIVFAGVVYTDSTPFPGATALVPAAGTVIALAAGHQRGKFTLARVSEWKPVLSIGAWSYSIYLWHWPLIVIAPFALQRQLGTLDLAAIFGISLVLGWMSYTLVENPVRRARRTGRPWPEFTFAIAIPVVIALAAWGQVSAISAANAVAAERAEQARVEAEKAAAEQAESAVTSSPIPCFGVTAILDPDGCIDPFTAREVIDTAWAATDMDMETCLMPILGEWRSCTMGDPYGTNGTIALVGDSHAAALAPAFDEFFAQIGWRVVTYAGYACGGLITDPDVINNTDSAFAEWCAQWGARVQQDIIERTDIDVVAYHVFDSRTFGEGDAAQQAQSVRDTWALLETSGKSVVLVRDIPTTGGIDIPTCLSQISLPADAPCSRPQSEAVTDNPVVQATGSGVPLVDITDLFCTDGTCMSYVGGVVAYADSNHTSTTYARSLAQIMGERIMAALSAA